MDHAAHSHTGSPRGPHEGHDKHAGHSPEMFKNRFWLSLALTLPILYFDPHIQMGLGYEALRFPGVGWAQPVLASALFFYGGWPFLVGAVGELRARQPGMMSLITLAITVAFRTAWRRPSGSLRGCRSTGSWRR